MRRFAALTLIVRGARHGAAELAAQSPGLLTFSLGLSANFLNDHEMLEHGMAMYDRRVLRDGEGTRRRFWVGVAHVVAADRKLVNQWAMDHTTTLAGGQPILALDMYEHSYHMDTGREPPPTWTPSWRRSTGRTLPAPSTSFERHDSFSTLQERIKTCPGID
jgi:hypothetical protein